MTSSKKLLDLAMKVSATERTSMPEKGFNRVVIDVHIWAGEGVAQRKPLKGT